MLKDLVIPNYYNDSIFFVILTNGKGYISSLAKLYVQAGYPMGNEAIHKITCMMHACMNEINVDGPTTSP